MTDQHLSPTRRQLIIDVSRQGLVFAEQCAVHVGEGTLDDPQVQAYYLVYVLGAIEYFGDHPAQAQALSDGEKLAAMAEALAAFDNATPEEIRRTVIALNAAQSEASLALRALGRENAAQAQGEERENALRAFAQLLNERERYLPIPLEPALASLAPPGPSA